MTPHDKYCKNNDINYVVMTEDRQIEYKCSRCGHLLIIGDCSEIGLPEFFYHDLSTYLSGVVGCHDAECIELLIPTTRYIRV